MPEHAQIHIKMLKQVAQALGKELCEGMTFVGGCTTSLLITDEYTREQVRHTDDVDLIVNVMGYNEWNKLQQRLISQGFRVEIPEDDEPICAMKLGELRVDFMPADESVLGFTNQWYQSAMLSAQIHHLDADLEIKVVSPVYFIATKLVAWQGRGNGDPLSSRDVEDILHVVDGREELISEIAEAPADVANFIAEEFKKLLANSDFDYAVQSQSAGDAGRETIIFRRIESIVDKEPR